MADAMMKKLAHLIDAAASVELRRAALQVASAIGEGNDAALARSVLGGLDHEDGGIRQLAIDAAGKLRLEASLPKLIAFASAGGPELEPAARSAGRLGAKGVKAMERIMTEATPVQRRRITAALAEGGTASAESAAAHALLDLDPGVVDAAARSLAAELPAMSPAHRKTLADYLIASLKENQKTRLPLASEAAMMRVLAALRDERAESLFWARLERGRAALIRATALQALGGFGVPKAEAKLQQLLDCAQDREFQVAAPALLILKDAKVDPRKLKSWLPLLQAPDIGTRRFAIDRLKTIESAEVARGMVGLLKHPDRGLRETAVNALAKSKPGRAALADALLVAANPDEAWMLARAQAPFGKQLPAALRGKLFAQARKYRDGDDRRADPLLFLLREIDPQAAHDSIVEHALALRKKKNYAAAVDYLKLLLRDPACGSETRFELAATGLKTSPRDIGPEAGQNDPTLAQFGRLLQDPDFDLFPRIKKLKWLEPEDLFYLGFHFAERNHREKEFGGQVLGLVVDRTPKSNLGKDAKRKLRSEGLG